MSVNRYVSEYSVDAAEALAYRAVAFIVSDQNYTADFLSRSGLSPEGLAGAIESRQFLAGVLDHLLSDESLLLAFCGNTGIDPGEVFPARNVLSSCDSV